VPVLERAGHHVTAVRHPQDTQSLPAPAGPGLHRETRPIDITDYPALLSAAEETRPEWILHLAAWTDVDGCESDPDRAFAVNGLGARNAALAAAAVGAAVLAMSTDYVFDGTATTPRREHDPVSPLASTAARRWRASRACAR
jgi:dTDP-4-dehydrorhamnose reductase